MPPFEAVAVVDKMTTTTKRLSPITRLWELLRQPQHPYRPATQIFLDLNVQLVARELNLEQRGSERGAENRPAESTQTLDDVEHQIIERVESHKQDAHALYLEHLHTYDERLAGLNFEERFAIIQQAAPQAVGDFSAEASLGRDELFELRRRLNESELEREQFRKQYGLVRPARLLTAGKVLLKVGVLAVLFVIELIINGTFLAKANEYGYLGGAILAMVFAAFNILVSFLCGLVPIRLVNQRSSFFKTVGFLSLVAYLVFTTALNLSLAQLREIPPDINMDVGQEVLRRITTAPFALTDFMSWLLFGVGFVFSVIAMVDGLLFFDPHIGYAGLERRWADASRKFKDTKAGLIDQLREIRDDAAETMNAAAHDLSVRRSEFDALLQARSRLAQRFIEHQAQIERACGALLEIYREANRKVRTTPAPSHFDRTYVMERIIHQSSEPDTTARDHLRQTIIETQELLKEQIKAINAAFDEAARSYRAIDEFFPETERGKAAS
ncbi:hypothetical protein [Bradyrhizobium sp. USDA 3315]